MRHIHVHFADGAVTHLHFLRRGTLDEFKEEEHPRAKATGKFVKGAGGNVPAPPQIKSTQPANYGKQKHLNALHEHAKSGEWGKVEAYSTPGTNTYAKMVQKYKADLLKQKPSGSAAAAPLESEKPTAAKPKLAPEKPAAIKAGEQAINSPLKLETLTKTGPQKGSNPGGTYTDKEGKQYYVKLPQSNDHAKNEMLAAALFRAAGGNTLTYHAVDQPDGKLGVGTELENLAADNMSQLTAAQRKSAQKDFALHAWLANWDAAGLSGDNVGVIAGQNDPIPLDFGGSLLYRAKGAPKGEAFGNTVTEWESLRNPYKNATAAKLYGDMTKEQLLESAQRLGAVTNEDIINLVEKYGPGETVAKAVLAEKLAARRNAVMQQAAAEAKKPAPPPPPPPNAPKPLSAAAASTPKPPAEIASLIAGKQYGAAYEALESHAPKITDTQKAALGSYKGSGYQHMNDCMRTKDNCDDSSVKELQTWLNQAKTPMPLTVWRRVKGPFAEALYSIGTVGMRFQERGFMSTALDPGPLKGWGPLTMEVQAPGGMPGTTVNNTGESEVLFNRGIHLTIKSFDRNKKHMVVTMDAGKAGEEL